MDNSLENALYSEVLVQCKDFLKNQEHLGNVYKDLKKNKNIWETFVTCFLHNFMVQFS